MGRDAAASNTARAARRRGVPSGVALVAALVAALASSVPAGAFHDTSLPLVHEATVVGAGWGAIRFHTEGRPYFIEVHTKGKNMRLDQTALLLYKADGTRVGWIVNNTYATQDGTYVQTTLADGQDQDTMTQGTSPFVGIGGSYKLNTNPATAYTGDLVAVFYGAGANVTSVAYALRGAAGTALLAEAHGQGAFIASTKDYFADVNVAAYRGSLGARVVYRGAMTRSATRTMFSFVYPLSSLVRGYAMAVQTPARRVACDGADEHGLQTGQPCLVEGIGAAAHGAGAYEYTITGGGLGGSGQPEVIVGGADVEIP